LFAHSSPGSLIVQRHGAHAENIIITFDTKDGDAHPVTHSPFGQKGFVAIIKMPTRLVDCTNNGKLAFTSGLRGQVLTRQDGMHAIYFKWKVASGNERHFENAWLTLTELIRDERGGLGSRLHRCADGYYFAYAQWPSEAFWAAQPEATARMVELRDQMREFAELVEGPLRGDVVVDLLVSVTPDQVKHAGDCTAEHE
jgi:hypothetical protein